MEISFKCAEKRSISLEDCQGFVLSEEEKVKFSEEDPVFALRKRVRVCLFNDEKVSICAKIFFENSTEESPFRIYKDLSERRVDLKGITSSVEILPNQTFECDISIVPERKFRTKNRASSEFCIEASVLGEEPRKVLSAKILEVCHKWSPSNKNKREAKINIQREGEYYNQCVKVLNPYYKNIGEIVSTLKISLNGEPVDLRKVELKKNEEIALEALRDLSEVCNQENTNPSYLDVENKFLDRSNFVNPEIVEPVEKTTDNLVINQEVFPVEIKFGNYQVPTSQIIDRSTSGMSINYDQYSPGSIRTSSRLFSQPTGSLFETKKSQHTDNPYPKSRTIDSSEEKNGKKCKMEFLKVEEDCLASHKKQYDYIIKQRSKGAIDEKYAEERLKNLEKSIADIYSRAEKRAEERSRRWVIGEALGIK